METPVFAQKLGTGKWVGTYYVLDVCPVCSGYGTLKFTGQGLWGCEKCRKGGRDLSSFRNLLSSDPMLKQYVVSIVDPQKPAELIPIAEYSNQYKGKLIGTGFGSIDYVTGGLTEGALTIITGKRGDGKCFAKGTRVVMYDGSLKRVEQVVVGDKLMGDDSTPRIVLNTSTGKGEMFEIKQKKGITYIVNGQHVLCLKQNPNYCGKGVRYSRYSEYAEMSVAEFVAQNETFRVSMYGYRAQVDFQEKKVNIDPYLLGVWLGDGTARTANITTEDKEIVDYLRRYAEKSLQVLSVVSENGKAKTYRIKKGGYSDEARAEIAKVKAILGTGKVAAFCRESNIPRKLLYRWTHNEEFQNMVSYYRKNLELPNIELIKSHIGNDCLTTTLSKYGVIENKHIPDDYLYNARGVRMNLLAGIIDTDGHLFHNCYEITQKNKRLAEQIRYLANSLGLRCSLKECRKQCCNNGVWGTYYRLNISGNTQDIPVKIQRKRIANYNKKCDPMINGQINVNPIGVGEYWGFEVDGNHKFLLEDFTVTHNSCFTGQLALNAVQGHHNVCFYSGELSAGRFQAWIFAQAAGVRNMEPFTDSFGATRYTVMVEAEKKIREWMGNKIVLYDNTKVNASERKTILKCFNKARAYYGSDLFFVDNLMTAQYDMDDEKNALRAQANFTSAIMDFARTNNVHVVMVAHPRKGEATDINESVAGLSEITNMATNVWQVKRFYREEITKEGCDAMLTISKNREYGDTGEFKMTFNKDCKRFIPQTGTCISKYGWESEA